MIVNWGILRVFQGGKSDSPDNTDSWVKIFSGLKFRNLPWGQ